MDVEQEITLDYLTNSGVSVKTQKYVMVDENRYPLGEPTRKAYRNTERERAEIAAELPEPYLSAVMAMWGDSPAIDDTQGGKTNGN